MKTCVHRTWFWWLNFIVLQWFFVRLARAQDSITGKDSGYVLWIGWVPLTGWGKWNAVFIIDHLIWL